MITIEKREDGRFDFTFSKDSYSGPQAIARKIISLVPGGQRSADSPCAIYVLGKSGELTNFFFLENTRDKSFDLVFREGKGPDLVCSVSAETDRRFCEKGRPAPRIVPLCDEANNFCGYGSSEVSAE